MSAMTSLKILLLGSPRIERDHNPISVDTRKAIALLAYLAVTQETHTRDALAFLLYPEYDQGRARAALRRTLSALKRGIGDGWLDSDRDTVALCHLPGMYLDVAEFRKHLAECAGQQPDRSSSGTTSSCHDCIVQLSAAADLYRDDFMAGFTLRDSAAFDEWQFLETERLRREYGNALEQLIRCLAAQDRLLDALEHARRWLALDPLHEPAHRALMLLYAWTGQHSAALRQYRQCVRILDSELGVAPVDQTTRLYEDIKERRLVRPVSRRQEEPELGRPSAPTWDLAAEPDGTQHPSASPTPLAASSLSWSRSSPERLPLVGRNDQIQRLIEAHRLVKNSGHLVLIEGEPGIGKTRLAEEFLSWAQEQGAVTLTGRCYEGEAYLAYSPWVDALRGALAQSELVSRLAETPGHWLAEVGRLLPEISQWHPNLPQTRQLDSPGAQAHFFEGVCQVLLALFGTDPPGVFFLDDLHWADEATINLLIYLVRRLQGKPLVLVATWTSPDWSMQPRHRVIAAQSRGLPGSSGVAKLDYGSDPDNAGLEDVAPEGHRRIGVALSERDERGDVLATHRLSRLLAEAQRNNLGTLLSLPRLGQEDVATLVSAASVAELQTSEYNERLYQESEGLPLFVAEYLASDKFANLQEADGRWAIPKGVRDLLWGRLASLDENARGNQSVWQVLTTAAAIGRSFDFDTVRMASGRSEEEVISSLEDLIARGLIREGHGLAESPHEPTYDFSHEQLRKLVYEETSLARRRLLHRRVAQALTRRHRRAAMGPIAAQVGHHYQLAGQEADASEYYRIAGEHARGLYANAEALTHFRLALALGHPATNELHEAIGDLETLAGRYDAALESYEIAAALADVRTPAAHLEHKLGLVHHRQGHWQLAQTYYQAAAEIWQQGEHSKELAYLYADWSLNAHRLQMDQQAQEFAAKSLILAERAQDARALAHAHDILGILDRKSGDIDGARFHLQQSLALAETLRDPSATVSALNNLGLAHQAAGQTDQAIALLERALALCSAQGDRHREAALHNNLADLLHADGQPQAAMEHLKQAVGIFAEIGQEEVWEPEIWKLVEW